MEAYQYKHGDRPLDGYTIERAAGRGGFGEVYYAVSDSGRQVALKAIQSHEQIELRGISQCMNLKSPHLVTVFDVKYNDQNRPFVIMEYVAGPALSDLLKESPGGLGTQKAAFFLREIAKGLSYLHECGIVHRDLKPSNIFYENGYVKIGDYGLTKAISTSRHVSHTITVGTVHYMAPEIGAGRYDRSVDIYALGVLLHEMLTGQVPFLGASPAEILMKHMTAMPDLQHIEQPFQRVICKALAKDPNDRYQTVQEMVEDVFGAEHVRYSVSQFAPEELSVVAEHIAQKMGRNQAKVPAAPEPAAQTPAEKDFSKEVGKKAEYIAKKVELLSGQMAEKLKTAKQRAEQIGTKHVSIADPIGPRQRRTLALVTMVAIAIGAGIFTNLGLRPAAIVFVMVGIASKIILYSRRQWWAGLDEDSRWLGKGVTCFGAAFAAVFASALVAGLFGFGGLGGDGGGHFGGFGPLRWLPFFRGFGSGPGGGLLAMALPMLLVDWWGLSDPQRETRVALGPALWAGFLGYVGGNMFSMSPIIVACALAGTALVIQTLSPFGRPVADVIGARGQEKRSGRGGITSRPLPSCVRPLWMIAWVASIGLGLFLCILAGTSLHGDSFGFAIAWGVDALIFSVLCFIMIFRGTFTGWYRYLIRPVLLTLCVQTTVTASVLLGTTHGGPPFGAFLFFIIFPNILFLILLFTPARVLGAGEVTRTEEPSARCLRTTPTGAVSPATRFWAAALAVVGPLFGLSGLHRFYVGKIGTGILWLFTGGLFLIGQIIDIIMILTGQFEDKNGLRVVDWHRPTLDATGTPQRPHAAPAAVATPEAQARPAHEPAVDQVVADHADAAEPTSPPMYASTGTIIYEPWHPFSGLICALGHIFLLLGLLVGLAIGLHLPTVVAWGWPDSEFVQELDRVFGYAEWHSLFQQAGAVLLVALFFIATILIMIGRRKSGGAHLVRALVGLGGIFGAIQLFRGEVLSNIDPRQIADLIQTNKMGQALERVFSACSQEEAVFAGIIALASVLILAWPPRRQTPIFAPMPHQQGVS